MCNVNHLAGPLVKTRIENYLNLAVLAIKVTQLLELYVADNNVEHSFTFSEQHLNLICVCQRKGDIMLIVLKLRFKV